MVLPPQSTSLPSITAPATHRLESPLAVLEAAADEDALLLLAALLAAEEALLEEAAEDALLDELEAALTAGPTEHQAESANALPPENRDCEQVKLPVSVAYTKLPALPRATWCVPLMVQLEPTWAHLVYPDG